MSYIKLLFFFCFLYLNCAFALAATRDEIVAFASIAARADSAETYCKDIQVNNDALKKILYSFNPNSEEISEIEKNLIPEWSEIFNTLIEINGADEWCSENITALTNLGKNQNLDIITQR